MEMSGSPTEESQEEQVGGFLVFNKGMVKNLSFKEDKADTYNSKLLVSMEVSVPYGVDVKRVAEDLSKLIGMVGCEGDVVADEDKDAG
jgi:hypothetical protein